MRVDVVNIPRCNNRLLELRSQLNHILQDVVKVITIRNHVRFQQRGIVGPGLNFDIVIVTRLLERLRIPLFHHCGKDFAGRTSSSQEKSFPVLCQQGSRNPRHPVKVANVGIGNQLKEVLQSCLRLGQQGDVEWSGVLVSVVFGHVLI